MKNLNCEWKEYNLANKHILVNGGSTGIGKKLTAFLISKGCKVIITSSNENNLKKTVNELNSAQLSYHVCDITNESQINDLIDKLKENKIDCLINCASILGPQGVFGTNNFDDWKRTIDINLIGNALLIKKIIPHLSKNSKIINFAGGGAANSRKYHTAYAVSKTAMVRLTEILAEEYKDKFDINIIAPGIHNTKMVKEEKFEPNPLRWADENKLFGLISFLLSCNSDGVTGRYIHIENDWKNFTKKISNTERFLLRRTD